MITILLIIPVFLFVTGIVQTFVLKSKQNELAKSKYALEQSKNEQDELNEEYEYVKSDEYFKDYLKHNEYDGKYYGEDGDIRLK